MIGTTERRQAIDRFYYANVELQQATIEIEQTMRWEGPLLRDIEYRVRARGLLNPAATAYILAGAQTIPISVGTPAIGYGGGITSRINTGRMLRPGDALGNPVYVGPLPSQMDGGTYLPPTLATNANSTKLAIQNWMSQPRAGLTVMSQDGTVILQSPGVTPESASSSNPQFYATDARLGPFPLVHNVVWHAGFKTWAVEMEVVTWVVPCDWTQGQAELSCLRTHLWRVHETLDSDAMKVRVITGTATFRADRLQALGLTADDFRPSLWHPCPITSRRAPAQTWLSEDGLTLGYSLCDREVPSQIIATLPQGKATRIEAVFKIGLGFKGLERTVTATLSSGISGAVRGSPGGAAAAAVSAFVSAAQAVYKEAPRTHMACQIRVWGNRFSRKNDLANVALAVWNDRLTILTLAGFVMSDQDFDITYDMMGRFVELSVTVQTGPIGSLGSGILELFPYTSIFGPKFANGVQVSDYDEIAVITTKTVNGQQVQVSQNITMRPENIATPAQLNGAIGITPEANLPNDPLPGPYQAIDYPGEFVAFPPQGARGTDPTKLVANPVTPACPTFSPFAPPDMPFPSDANPGLPWDGHPPSGGS